MCCLKTKNSILLVRMKKILFPCLLLAAIAMHAQNVTITLSKEFALKDPGSTLNESMYKLGDFFYMMELDYKGMQLAYTAKLEKIKYAIIVHKYDSEMKEVAKYTVGNGKEFGPFPGHMVIYDNQLVVFYYQVQEGHIIKLLMTAIDPGALAEQTTKELYNITEKNTGFFGMINSINNNSLKIWPSPEQGKLLLCQSGNTPEIFSCVINNKFDVVQSRTSVVKVKYPDFKVNNAYIDDNGNNYFSYTYTLDKVNKRGILAQTAGNKEAYVDFTSGNALWEANVLSFHKSADNATLYVYANYYGDFLDEGLMVTTFNTPTLKFGKPDFYAYPQHVRERMKKMGFAEKQKGTITVRRVDFVCNDMEDGTLAFSGTPVFAVSGETSKGYTISKTYTGPIINFFVKNSNYNIGIVYRSIPEADPAGVIVMPFKNNLLLIYNDGPKNINIKDTSDYDDVSKPSGLVLAKALVSANGEVLSKQQISDNPVGSNYFFTTYRQRLGANRYLIPIGRERVNMVRYFTEIVQWATIDIQ